MENKVFENKVMAIVDRICDTESTNCRSLNKSDLAMELFQLAGIDASKIDVFEIPLDWDRMVAITYTNKSENYGNAYELTAGIGTNGEFFFERNIVGTFKNYVHPFKGETTEMDYFDDPILVADYASYNEFFASESDNSKTDTKVMEKAKKQFQKVIGSIRKERNTANNINSNFPKAMMTFAQMDKKQATVNCGGEWYTAETTKQIADIVLNDSRFIKFLSDNSATAKTEYNNFGSFQIRIYF